MLGCGFALTDMWVWELDLTIQLSIGLSQPAQGQCESSPSQTIHRAYPAEMGLAVLSSSCSPFLLLLAQFYLL